jgi:hypothetical protein
MLIACKAVGIGALVEGEYGVLLDVVVDQVTDLSTEVEEVYLRGLFLLPTLF